MNKCDCGMEFNFLANGNMNGKAVLVVDPTETDFKKGRVLSREAGGRPNPMYEAFRLEMAKVGLNLEYDFLILPSYYHPNPKKQCYEFAMKQIFLAGEVMPVKSILICSNIVSQLAENGNFFEALKLYATMIPFYEPTKQIYYMIIDGNIMTNLGEFQFGFKRFSKFLKEVENDLRNNPKNE